MGPPVVYMIEPEGALAIEFVEGEVMHPDRSSGHPDRLRQVVETVKALHDRGRLQQRDQVFDMIRKYTKIAGDVNAPMARRIQAMLKVMDDVEAAMARLRCLPSPATTTC